MQALCSSSGAARLRNKLAVDGNACAAIVVQAPAITAALVGVQVYAARLGCRAAHEVDALVQLAQLRTLQAPLF